MNDDFLHGLRRDPSPELAGRLKRRLRGLDNEPRARIFPPLVTRFAVVAASVAALGFAFTFPTVRAGAQAFLDLFRVSSFVGVAFDPTRLRELESTGLDWPKMVGEQIEVVTQPSAPVSYATPQEAGAAAGIRVYAPTWLPTGVSLESTQLVGESAFRFTASTTKLRQLLDALRIDDVAIPEGVDGQRASVRVPPVVQMAYAGGGMRAMLTQSRSPDVSFPAGLDVPVLAEIGLRILGLDRAEAYRVARQIDWRTTLVVPVPATIGAFRDVNVQGQPALLIQATSGPNGERLNENVLLWSLQGIVYSLRGTMGVQPLLDMAQSMQ
jgi:hypothetical protein